MGGQGVQRRPEDLREPRGAREEDAGHEVGPTRAPTLVVIGGGTAGDFYVRQLLRAVHAGRLETRRIVVVDRDPRCAAAARLSPAGARPAVELDVADWDDWLANHLGTLEPEDQLVPYHWAPHLLLRWLVRVALQAGARAERLGGVAPRGLPFERETSEGDRALSYADWPCPPSCIEPALCPHTRGPRSWSLAADLATGSPDDRVDQALVLPSLHLSHGVAAIPIRAMLSARDSILGAARGAGGRFLVSTASHCHGLAARLRVHGRTQRIPEADTLDAS